MTQRLSSTERRISFCTQTRVVSQLWCSLYADCKHTWRPFSCKWSRARTEATFSIAFEINCKFETGRKLGYSSWSNRGFFSKGDKTACFKDVGTVLDENERLMIRVITGSRSSKHRISKLAGIGSRQQDFLALLRMRPHNSVSVVGMKQSCWTEGCPAVRWRTIQCHQSKKLAALSVF